MIALSAIALWAAASVVVAAPSRPSSHNKRQLDEPFSLPGFELLSAVRATAVEVKREGWLYGPSRGGNTSFYPAGTLGSVTALAQSESWSLWQNAHTANVGLDAKEAAASIVAAGGITNLGDYEKLYDGLWPRTVPDGPLPGLLSNYTSDLLFGMARLSTSPYSVSRVLTNDSLLFAVDNAAAISGLSLDELKSQGRLFVVDYSDQIDLPKQDGKYGAACQAYFYIHPESEEFLPLAIKPNAAGSDLVYTPQDTENDWLLAKMMFNLNDVWFLEWYHLAGTHALSEIVYLAAIRTLSEDHPLMAILHRLMNFAWAMRPAAEQRLIYSGGPVDALFPWAGSIAGEYTDGLYKAGRASAFQANYFHTDLEKRGLINYTGGPRIKSFPYYEDASVVFGAVKAFMKVSVESYYTKPDTVTDDIELQAWIQEAVLAEIIDFPAAPLEQTDQIVDIMAHMAFLVSIKHGVTNSNSPVASIASLPFHPLAFYAPLPTEKGVADIMPFMPKLSASLSQISLLASFNRPEWAGTNETLLHMFNTPDLILRMTPQVQQAELAFRAALNVFSKIVDARKFDKDGLSQGMPIIWKALDPNKTPFWFAI